METRFMICGGFIILGLVAGVYIGGTAVGCINCTSTEDRIRLLKISIFALVWVFISITVEGFSSSRRS